MNAPRVGGIYQHYKGGFYRVRGIAEHTENEGQMLVIYHDDAISQANHMNEIVQALGLNLG